MIPTAPSPAVSELLGSRSFRLIIIISLLIGLGCAWLHRNDDASTFKGDDADYHRLAVGLVNDFHFASTYRAPAYPFVVSGIYALSAKRPLAVFLFQAVLFSASVLLTGLTIAYITNNKMNGLLTAAAIAFFPPFSHRQ